MSSLPHRVRRLSLQVHAPSSRDALAVRKAVHDELDAVTAAMARVFDELGAHDAIVVIRRLELRARFSSAGELRDALARRVEQELRRQLTALRPGAALD